MSDADQDFEIPLFVDKQTNTQLAVMANLSEEEFAWAQVVVPDLIRYPDYQDWLDHREGYQIGLSMAGLEVNTVAVALVPFLTWCRLFQTRPSQRALDAFALSVFQLRKLPIPTALAMISENQFELHALTVEAFASYGSFGEWTLHRAAMQAKIGLTGARPELVPVNVDDFVAWSRCLRQATSEALLDCYARLILEFLTQET